MKAFKIIFKSGVAMDLYGDTVLHALEGAVRNDAAIDAVVDIAEQQQRGEIFKASSPALVVAR